MKNPCRRPVLALSLGFLVSQVLSAQSDLGTISGFVKDPSGATVPNAKVTVQNQSGVDREATTNESGYYTITNVPPGSYKMSVEASGFKRYESTNNKLDPSAADVDSTQEVEILTADYAAEYGRSSGAQIRVVTKSGTQQFHGSAYEYDRNTAFNANTWSRDANPLTPHAAQFQYNQFGYNFGGPLYIPNRFNTDKSKVFFYWGQEWVRYHFIESGSSVGSAGLLEVPTVTMRQGDFDEVLDPE